MWARVWNCLAPSMKAAAGKAPAGFKRHLDPLYEWNAQKMSAAITYNHSLALTALFQNVPRCGYLRRHRPRKLSRWGHKGTFWRP